MMVWQKMAFVDALKGLLRGFEEYRHVERLALIWRKPNEWSVMDEWMVDQIKGNFDGATLRIAMWITRADAAELMSVLYGGK